MSAGAAAPERRPRLSPFAFPSDTAFRFGVLVTAVVGANLYVWQWIASTTRSTTEHTAGALACLQLSTTNATTEAQFGEASKALTACYSDLYGYQVGWMLGGTALLLITAAAIMVGIPLWITRRRHLQPLMAEDAPAAIEAVRELAREQGIREPRVFWNPLDPSPTGLAFGHPGRYSVALSGGLVVKQATDPPAFRAIVRHELAHIRNRDVGITYFTLAIWYAFLLVAVLPFALTLLDEGKILIWSVTWRLLALALLVYLTRNAVLRSREVYADLRASVPDGPTGALRRVVAALPAPKPGLLGRVRRVHPDPQKRLAALDDTRPLFPLGAVVAFAAGLTATVAYGNVNQLLSTVVTEPFDLSFLSALAITPLAVGVVGVAIWREAFAALADGREPASPWIDALAFAAGLMLGPELALEGVVVTQNTLLRDLTNVYGFLWAAVLIGGVMLLFAWIRTCASLWLRALGGRRSRASEVAGLLIAASATTVFIGVFYAARELRPSLAFSRLGSEAQHAAVDAEVWTVPLRVWQYVMDGELLFISQKPYFVPVLALLSLFPLSAALVRRRPTEAPWAFLDPGSELHTPKLDIRPLQPLLIGAAAGLGFLVLAAFIRLGMHYGVSAETRAMDATLLSFYVSMVALAILVQLAAGAAAAWRSGLIGALGASFVAGCFGWLGVVGGPTAGGCVAPLSLNPGPCAWTIESTFSWHVFQQVIAQGAVAGLTGGLVVVGVQAVLHRRTAEELHPAAAG